MSRTYRNRHAAPKNAVVRDGGQLYVENIPCYGGRRGTVIRRGPLRQERKSYRVEHQRRYRAKVRDRLAHNDWENVPRFRRTGGWLTW